MGVGGEPGARPADTLGMSPEEMRRLGYWVVDAVVDHFERGHGHPVVTTRSPAELEAVLGGPCPEEGGDALEAMGTLVDVALSAMQHGDHPRYFARVPGPSSFAAVLGDWLATGFNAIAASWGGGAGTTAVELAVLEWLRTLVGMPEETQGVLTSGGSLANITGLVAARCAMGSGRVYFSDQTHASIRRGLLSTGFAADDLRCLATDGHLRMSTDALAEAVRLDRQKGPRPTIVIANAGTTNTGAVDPLVDLADFCRSEDLWLHVDGAYGAPAVLCDKGRRVLSGIDRADSLVLDPHKWLFQPYDTGSLLVRRPGALEAAFHMAPEYLMDVTARHSEVDMRDRSLELTRRARALKLWLTFRTYGSGKIRAAIDRGIELAEHAESLLASDDRWQIVTPAQLAIVTFVRSGPASQDYGRAAAQITESGYAALTSTTLHGMSVLRLCTINPRTTEADIAATIARLLDITERT